MCRRNETWRAVDPACWKGADKDFVDSQEGDPGMACASSQEEWQAPLLAFFVIFAYFRPYSVLYFGALVFYFRVAVFYSRQPVLYFRRLISSFS